MRFHNAFCKMTNGGFLYECECYEEEEFLEKILKNSGNN